MKLKPVVLVGGPFDGEIHSDSEASILIQRLLKDEGLTYFRVDYRFERRTQSSVVFRYVPPKNQTLARKIRRLSKCYKERTW